MVKAMLNVFCVCGLVFSDIAECCTVGGFVVVVVVIVVVVSIGCAICV